MTEVGPGKMAAPLELSCWGGGWGLPSVHSESLVVMVRPPCGPGRWAGWLRAPGDGRAASSAWSCRPGSAVPAGEKAGGLRVLRPSEAEPPRGKPRVLGCSRGRGRAGSLSLGRRRCQPLCSADLSDYSRRLKCLVANSVLGLCQIFWRTLESQCYR